MKTATINNVNKKLSNGWVVDYYKTIGDNAICLKHETTEGDKKRIIDLYYSKDWRTGANTIKAHVNNYTRYYYKLNNKSPSGLFFMSYKK